MEQNEIKNRITDIVHKKDSNAEVILFGSRARDNNKPDSDWDVLILVDDLKITNEIEDKFRNELYDVEIESGQSISILIYSKQFWNNTLIYSPLYKNIQAEGIRL